MTDAIDSKITELFAVLTKQKAEVAAAVAASTKKWKTNGSLVLSEGTHPINVQTLSEKMVLACVADLLNKQNFLTKAAELLGTTWDNKVGGYDVDDWIEDFKTRIAKIQLSAKQEKLAILEKRLDAIVSPEQRRQMELLALTKELED